MSQQCVLAAKAANSIPGCFKRSTGGRLRDLLISLFLAFERLHQEQRSSSGLPRTRQILKQWSKTTGRLQCHIQDRQEAERAGLAQPREGQLKVRAHCCLQQPNKRVQGRWNKTPCRGTQGHDKRQWTQAELFQFDIREREITLRVVKHWARLPRNTVAPASLDTVQLDWRWPCVTCSN